MPAEATMRGEAMSEIPCETVSAEASEAMSGMLREIVVIVPMTKVPVMVEVSVMTEVVEAAKAETK